MLGGDYVAPEQGHFCGEDCANKWRGMLFGMTNRAGWHGFDPNSNSELWRLWDDFKIEAATMYGWWNASNPVRIIDEQGDVSQDVLGTAYVQPGIRALVAIATWSNYTNETVSLEVDWEQIGLKDGGTVTAPLIPSFNRANESLVFPMDADGRVKLVVPAYEGWLLVLA